MQVAAVSAVLDNSKNAEHFVRFYDEDVSLLTEGADFIDSALRAGDIGIIIATPDHISELRRRLSGLGSRSSYNIWFPGKLITLDAESTLGRFMVDGWPDESRFYESVGKVVQAACAEGAVVNVFGEMVALLCASGLHRAAIRLEQLWNFLATKDSFSLFCAYPWHLFPKAELIDTFRQVCAEHDPLCVPSHLSISAESKDVHFRHTELEQKARVLKAEVELRIAAEQTLKRRENELAHLVENAAEGIHDVDANGTILWVNKAKLAMLGYYREEYFGRHIAEFHVDRPVIESILHKPSTGATLYDPPARVRCRDGSVKHVVIYANGSFGDGQLRHTRFFTRDATDRHQRDEALAQRDRVLLQAPVAITLLVGQDFTFQLASRRFCEATTHSAVEGKTFAQMFPETRVEVLYP